jgi:hypothetical protein
MTLDIENREREREKDGGSGIESVRKYMNHKENEMKQKDLRITKTHMWEGRERERERDRERSVRAFGAEKTKERQNFEGRRLDRRLILKRILR